MQRRMAGFTVAAALTGCVGLAGSLPGPAEVPGPRIMPATPGATIVGRAADGEATLTALRAGLAESRRFTLEADDFVPAESELTDRIFPDYRSAIAYAEGKDQGSFLPSADMVAAVTKQINDGIYARMELALERGEGGFTAKRVWLRQLLTRALQDTTDPAAVSVAARLAATTALDPMFVGDVAGVPPIPAAVTALATPALQAFRDDAMLSKPIGFYSWTPELAAIFQRDRWLQGWFGETKRATLSQDRQPIEGDDANLAAGAYLAGLLTGDAGAAHEQALTFYKRMTNPLSGYAPKDLVQLLPTGKTLVQAVSDPGVRAQMLAQSRMATTPFLQYWAILPPSTSPESELFYKLQTAGLLKPGQDRMQVLIDAIRGGQISLAPKTDSGFYAYQQHALEALLKVGSLPESTRLTYGPAYQKRLEEAFKSGMTKARETQVKQLDSMPTALPMGIPTAMPGSPPWVVEPLPTYYERLSASYGFLKTAVLPQFDTNFTSQANVLTDGGGEGALSLAAAVEQAERFTSGLTALAKAEVGLAPIAGQPGVAEAAAWLANLGQDKRLGQDTRVAVPVNEYTDAQKRSWMQYWGTAGVTLSKIKVSGAGEKTYLMATDRFIFFDRPYAAGPLTRTEYRQILSGSANLGEALKRLRGT